MNNSIINTYHPKDICENVLMDFDSLQENKTGMGTGAVIVIDKQQDIIKCISRLSDFSNMKVVDNVLLVEKDVIGCQK